MDKIKDFIETNCESEYAAFNNKLISTKHKIKGVRLPTLRKFAKSLKPEDVKLNKNSTHEEILLCGFAAGNLKTEQEQLEAIVQILPFIDNWCACDCIVMSLKKMTGEKAYQFFSKLLKDKGEFFVRVGIIGLMRFFITSEKLPEILLNLKKVKCEEYYVKMALAWFYAELASKNFALAKQVISEIDDKFLRNKAISKARESFRVTQTQKAELSKLRK